MVNKKNIKINAKINTTVFQVYALHFESETHKILKVHIQQIIS